MKREKKVIESFMKLNDDTNSVPSVMYAVILCKYTS